MTKKEPSSATSKRNKKRVKEIQKKALLILGLLSTASAAPTPGPSGKEQAEGTGIVQFIDVESLTVHVSDNSLREDKKEHEFQMIMHPVDKTIKAAGELQRLWKTYQDKSRWRMQLGLNASFAPPPLPPLGMPHDHYGTSCIVPLGDISNSIAKSMYGAKDIKDFPDPENKTDWETSWNMKDFQMPGKVEAKTYPNDLSLKWWGSPIDLIQFQSFPVNEVCTTAKGDSYQRTLIDGLYPIDGQSAYGMEIKFYLATKQMSFNQSEIKKRQELACADIQEYYKEYVDGVFEVLKQLPGGLMWSSTNNALGGGGKKMALYNVGTMKINATALSEIQKLAQDSNDPGVVSYLIGASPKTAGGEDEAVGAKKYEDLKRSLPTTNPIELSRIGYANIFQVWADLDTVIEPKTIFLHTASLTCGLWGCSMDPYGKPVPGLNVAMGSGVCKVLPGNVSWPPATNLGRTVHVLPRFHFRWVSVGEGHTIPDVSGDPMGLPAGLK